MRTCSHICASVCASVCASGSRNDDGDDSININNKSEKKIEAQKKGTKNKK